MIKRTVSLLLSLALLVNGVQPIHAADLVAIPQNVHLPTPPSSIQTRSSELSFKSIETKVNNVLKSEKTQPKVAATYSGTCGTNVKWSLNTSTGKLTISGSGAMWEYAVSNVPWKSYRSYIKTVVIENGVTFFSCNALRYCSRLTSVTIPASVKTIETTSFCSCPRLTSIKVATNNPQFKSINGVLFNKAGTQLISYPGGKSGRYTIPSSVTSIGHNAFNGCTGLTSVTIPDSVISIGLYVFEDCTGLTSVNIPDSVTSIGSSAFRNCSGLTSITVDQANSNYKSIDGVLFNKAGTILIACPAEKSGSYTIPSSVTTIYSYAFEGCSGLTSVTYEGTTDPDNGSSIFTNTQVTKVNVPCEYKNLTFCGLDIKRRSCHTMRAIHLDRPFSFLRHLLNLFLLGKE